MSDGLAGMVMVLACGLAELSSFFGQFQGLALPVVEAFGVGPVNAGAGDAIEGGHGVTRTAAGFWPLRSPRSSLVRRTGKLIRRLG